MDSEDFLCTQNWYPVLAEHTFLTSFLRLSPEDLQLLYENKCTGKKAEKVIASLNLIMQIIPGNCFVFVDRCAPTDTERFEAKRGAVYSANSAWKFLGLSNKVHAAIERNEVSNICVRPFRRMNKTREFRLFIKDGKLMAMSQYHLIRHFRRLEGVKGEFWKKAEEFVSAIEWRLPIKTLVMDIYFTASGKILIIDLNPWGPNTDPLLLRKWDIDWSKPYGIVLMSPPLTISGDVNVSF